MRKFIINLFIISSLFSLVLLAVPYATIPPNMATGYDNGFNVFPLDSISVDILFVGPSTLSFGLHQETLLESGFDFLTFGENRRMPTDLDGLRIVAFNPPVNPEGGLETTTPEEADL